MKVLAVQADFGPSTSEVPGAFNEIKTIIHPLGYGATVLIHAGVRVEWDPKPDWYVHTGTSVFVTEKVFSFGNVVSERKYEIFWDNASGPVVGAGRASAEAPLIFNDKEIFVLVAERGNFAHYPGDDDGHQTHPVLPKHLMLYITPLETKSKQGKK